MLSMTSDYFTSTGCPEPYLSGIADAGFSRVHWCHHWNTDFVYSTHEIEQIGKWFEEYGLELTDLHASAGVEKNWGSPLEYERLAGVELVRNRIEMTARLGSDVVIMHLPPVPEDASLHEAARGQLWKSLDELRPFAEKTAVRIAIENGDFDRIEEVFSRYGAEYVGLCYDSGHGNMRSDGLERLERNKDRLISVHLHDNDGESDQHKLLFSGTIDWEKLAGIIARSSYAKWVSMETTMGKSGIKDEMEFLGKAFETGTRFAAMIEDQRKGTP